MKRNTYAFFAAISVVIMSSAAVPIHWQVETSRLQPVAFDALHGETLELSASFQSYGKPLAVTGPAALYYQTNGMGSAWWQVPATVASNRIEAVFTPADDPGAPRLNCFLGGTASTYRAAFALRFANSPGAQPNVMPWPSTHAEAAEIISNIVTRYYLQDHLTPSVDRKSYTAPRFNATQNPGADGLISSEYPLAEYSNAGIKFTRFERSIFVGLTRIVNNFLFPSNRNEGGMIATREYINALDFANIDYVDTSASNTLMAAKAYADENGGAVSSVNGEVGDVQLTAAKVGALPADGTAKEAFFALESSSAKEADFAYKARDAEIANYALMAGGVNWYDIVNRPTWIGTEKPSYTAIEVGATTPQGVTNIVRDLSLGGIWDAEMQVWWTPRMRNGSLTYEATTNVNLNAEN